ncbi:contractile injection system tape measure protein [Algoriphagus litoralis]|uniref:contractile injection system tape measure protein n=1 Tax=Algoriphagus litoralis TaxID=2202829 RepID=UPI000DB9A8C4|nr:contractile injection system tape measure protein [Algoriphagus litoralis]
MSRHLIHRQILDLRYTDERRAKAAMDQWGERYEKDWLPVIEEVLDELDQEGKWFRLEQVELDLGRILENQSPEIFHKKLKEMLKTQLLRQIPELSEANKPQKTQDYRQPQDESKPLELLIYLLQYGRKPWWASKSKKEGIKDLIKMFVSEKNKRFLTWMQSEAFSPVMLERLRNHLETDEIQKMLSLAFPEKRKESQILIKSLLATFSPELYLKDELERGLEARTAEAFLLAEKQLENPVTQWLKTWLIHSKTAFRPTQEALAELLIELIPADFFQKSRIGVLEKIWSKWTKTPIFKYSSPRPQILKNGQETGKDLFLKFLKTARANFPKSSLGDISAASLSASKLAKTRKEKTSITEKLELDETFPISNSGLVLAAPFLPYFFKGLGLVENKAFVSLEAQNRGVLLIQALLDESYSYQESDLLLNKILCGMSPSEPIQVNFSPSELEKEEIKNLLDAMVTRWTALKSTSGASMAKGFFPREGSLRRVDKGFQLQIPRISIDILLNRLPWTISIIKLPWMEETLYTEW